MSTFEATGIVSAIAASAGAMAAILGAFTQWRKNKPQGDAQDNRKAVREGDNEFPTEPASQRRDYAEEQEARLKRHMEAIQSVLELEKDAKRREVLETSLRDVQDRWLHHLEIGTLFLDEADPSLLDDPKYVLALRAQLRSEAPKATAIEPATPAEAQSRRELLDRIARSAEAEPSAADLLAEANTLRSVGDHAAAIEKYTLSLGKEESFDAFFGRGYSRNELGSHEDALADYDRALRLQQDDPVTHLTTAALLSGAWGDCPKRLRPTTDPCSCVRTTLILSTTAASPF